MSERIVDPVPLGPKGRVWLSLTLLCLIFLWAVALYAYRTLPEQVPTHFGWAGKPTAWGSKTVILFIALVFSLAPVSILLVVHYRFVLINRYPYLINLPAFFMVLSRIPPEERGRWVNRYFEILLGLDFFLSLYLLVLEGGIYLGQRSGKLPEWFAPGALILPFLILVPWLYSLFRISRELQERYGKG